MSLSYSNRSPVGLPLLLFFAYNSLVPNVRCCLVSFTDSGGIRHAVEVTATALYDAAVLAMA